MRLRVKKMRAIMETIESTALKLAERPVKQTEANITIREREVSR